MNEVLFSFFRCNNIDNLFDNPVYFKNVEKFSLIDTMSHNRHRQLELNKHVNKIRCY